MNARIAALVLASAAPVLAAPAHAPAPAAPAPDKAAAKSEPVPKALPREGDGKTPEGNTLPPFLGMFGPAALIQKTGFRSAPGRYIEYALENQSGQAAGASMRIQEVGPVTPGARWIELIAQTGGNETNGMKMLARGEKDGNLERMIASMPGFPAMEFPLDGATIEADKAPAGAPPMGAGGATHFGTPKKVGREAVEVPLGKFECDHWVVDADPGKMEFWVVSDPKIPFIGAVKMSSADGAASATKVGTDAVAKIAVPPKPH